MGTLLRVTRYASANWYWGSSSHNSSSMPNIVFEDDGKERNGVRDGKGKDESEDEDEDERGTRDGESGGSGLRSGHLVLSLLFPGI